MPCVLLVLIIRNGQNIIPNGDTIIEKGDRVVLCGSSFVDKNTRINLYENVVDKNSKYKNKSIRELDKNTLIVMIKRDDVAMIPSGNTTILENDILVLLDR
jgi:Na+/H+ antiporter